MLEPFTWQFDLHVLNVTALSALLFWQTQMPKQFQHTPVFAHHQCVEAPNAFISCFADQLAGQGYPYPVALPAILDEGRVLGSFVTRLAVIACESDDLVRVVGVQCDQSEVVYTINVREILSLLFGELF